MKLKKLLKVISPHQPIRLITTNGCITHKCEVIRVDDGFNQPLFDLVEEYKVLSIRSVYDKLQLPDYQDIIEIKIGGNEHD